MFGTMTRRRGRIGVLIAALVGAGALTVWSPPAPANGAFCIIQPGYKCLDVTVTPTGNGTGTFKTTDSSWTSPDGFINCDISAGVTTGTCDFWYQVPNNTTLTIYWQAKPAAGSLVYYFSGGGKTIQNGVTTIPWSTANSATIPLYPVGFNLASPVTVTVSAAGSGKGSITSNPAGISCGTACSGQFAAGQPMTLTAKPATGSVFGGWSGVCQGQGSVCKLTPVSNMIVAATFTPPATPSPKATPTASATPSATPSPSQAASGPEAVAGASATPSDPAVPAAAGGAGTDMTPIGIAIVLAAMILGTAILIGFVAGPRRRRREQPRT